MQREEPASRGRAHSLAGCQPRGQHLGLGSSRGSQTRSWLPGVGEEVPGQATPAALPWLPWHKAPLTVLQGWPRTHSSLNGDKPRTREMNEMLQGEALACTNPSALMFPLCVLENTDGPNPALGHSTANHMEGGGIPWELQSCARKQRSLCCSPRSRAFNIWPVEVGRLACRLLPGLQWRSRGQESPTPGACLAAAGGKCRHGARCSCRRIDRSSLLHQPLVQELGEARQEKSALTSLTQKALGTAQHRAGLSRHLSNYS